MSVSKSSDWTDANQNGTAKTIKFDDAAKKEESSNLKCSMLDISKMGKHYLVKSTSHPITRGAPSADGEYDDYKGGIKRQYT